MKLELTEDELKQILSCLKQSILTMHKDHSKVSFISSRGIGLEIDELEKLKKVLVSFWDYEQDLKAEIKKGKNEIPIT